MAPQVLPQLSSKAPVLPESKKLTNEDRPNEHPAKLFSPPHDTSMQNHQNERLQKITIDDLSSLFKALKTLASIDARPERLANLADKKHKLFQQQLEKAEEGLQQWANNQEILYICERLTDLDQYSSWFEYWLVRLYQYLYFLKNLADTVNQHSATNPAKKLAKNVVQNVATAKEYLRECACDEAYLNTLSAQLRDQRSQRLEGEAEHSEYLYSLISSLQYRYWLERPGDRERARCQTLLISELQQLRNLAQSSHHDANEKRNDAWMKVLEQIHEFVLPLPEKKDEIKKELANWVNIKLRLKFELKDLPVQDEKERKVNKSLDQSISSSQDANLITLADLLPDSRPSTLWEIFDAIDEEWRQKAERLIARKLLEYLEQDPDGILRAICSRDYPQCTLHEVIIRRVLTFPAEPYRSIGAVLGTYPQVPHHLWKAKGGMNLVYEIYCGLAALEIAQLVIELLVLVIHLPIYVHQLSFGLIDQISFELEHNL